MRVNITNRVWFIFLFWPSLVVYLISLISFECKNKIKFTIISKLNKLYFKFHFTLILLFPPCTLHVQLAWIPKSTQSNSLETPKSVRLTIQYRTIFQFNLLYIAPFSLIPFDGLLPQTWLVRVRTLSRSHREPSLSSRWPPGSDLCLAIVDDAPKSCVEP